MAKILLTGATGFLGRHIYRILMNGPHDVYPTCGRLVDLFNPREANRLIDKVRPEWLIANAWMAVPKIFWDHPSNTQWVVSTKHLIDEFYNQGGTGCIFVSSMAAEEHQDTLYGQCKRQVEDYRQPKQIVRIGYLRGENEARDWAVRIVRMIHPIKTPMELTGAEGST